MNETERKVIKKFYPCQASDSMICDRDPELLIKCGMDDFGDELGCPVAERYLKIQALTWNTSQLVRLEFVNPGQIEAIVDFENAKSIRGVQAGTVYHEVKSEKNV